MNKYLFWALTLPSILSASVAELQTLYDQKMYAEVIKKAKSNTSYYGNVKLHILWGQSAEALGNEEEAISAYERVLMMAPDNSMIRVKLAKLYIESNRQYLTQQLSEDSEDYQLKRDEKDVILGFLQDDSPWSAFASLGLGYDSNINVSPGDLDIPVSEDVISSKFIRYQAGASYTYESESIKDLYMRSGVSFSYQDNEAEYFNLFAGVANAGFGYRNDRYDLYLPLKYSRIYYLNRDLMESMSVTPDMDIILTKTLIANLNAKYSKRSFIQKSDALMDDSVLGAGLGLYWLFGDNLAYIKTNYNDYDAKNREESQYIEKSVIALDTGITYYLDDLSTLNGSYIYRHTSYDDTLPSSDEKRSDDYHKLGMKLTRTVMDDVAISLDYSYTVNRSNYDISEYDKNIIICNIAYTY